MATTTTEDIVRFVKQKGECTVGDVTSRFSLFLVMQALSSGKLKKSGKKIQVVGG